MARWIYRFCLSAILSFRDTPRVQVHGTIDQQYCPATLNLEFVQVAAGILKQPDCLSISCRRYGALNDNPHALRFLDRTEQSVA